MEARFGLSKSEDFVGNYQSFDRSPLFLNTEGSSNDYRIGSRDLMRHISLACTLVDYEMTSDKHAGCASEVDEDTGGAPTRWYHPNTPRL
ncbi:hypothetical protein MRB53_013845 [Persea americana]|uniref:Uncharacterized protein n=1 Tax=Persea americana TaxID=3435 RepID=A0ACC2K960_PERAE|nr:hypothetical protein MRB53_013845 [Persea americana]